MTKEEVNHENMRRKLWCDIATAYVSSSNAIKSDGAANWANKALESFDEKFPRPIPEPRVTVSV